MRNATTVHGTLRHLSTVVLLCAAVPLSAQQDGRSQITQLFESTYIKVLCADSDPQILRKTFRPEFNMYILYNDEIIVRSLDEWIGRLEANRGKSKLTRGQITRIDVTGNAAAVTLQLRTGDSLVYTDLFTLYKLEEGWRVFTKTFHMH